MRSRVSTRQSLLDPVSDLARLLPPGDPGRASVGPRTLPPNPGRFWNLDPPFSAKKMAFLGRPWNFKGQN